MNTPPDQLGLLLHDAARLLRKRFEERAAHFGLSSAQWRLLVHVLRETRVSQARLADRLEIEPISVSRLVDRMEQAGWVTREPDPDDRRVRVIVATDKTRALRDQLKSTANAVYDEALSGLDPSGRAALLIGLSSVISSLSTPDDGLDDCPRKH
ncbi:MAG: MarR family transcriptional regulator [Rhodobacterales bacterium RIFCSPHIGHO2_02_FULL_62_130]|jgi:DNA-binding MarR family transcriptional regulator|nr:MAG: MarR family transcriptional regulator [Rhodobacterales bacterium RIFCSPHIGHO2_02_FULL_62_130]OHC57204.1 MAG: MarR family transcriptional regulator [Rhodobacterales bacterium RIFCSPHIGHO2_12_FULL_62_75]HCZ01346.1 MarR family transcriptional regulator [Rhodobacter sp.]